jgi:hypothetical protein
MNRLHRYQQQQQPQRRDSDKSRSAASHEQQQRPQQNHHHSRNQYQEREREQQQQYAAQREEEVYNFSASSPRGRLPSPLVRNIYDRNRRTVIPRAEHSHQARRHQDAVDDAQDQQQQQQQANEEVEHLQTLLEQHVEALHTLSARLQKVERERAESRASRRIENPNRRRRQRNGEGGDDRDDRDDDEELDDMRNTQLNHLRARFSQQQQSIARLQGAIDYLCESTATTTRQLNHRDTRQERHQDIAHRGRQSATTTNGWVIGLLIMVGLLVLLLIIAAVAFVVYKCARRRESANNQTATTTNSTSSNTTTTPSSNNSGGNSSSNGNASAFNLGAGRRASDTLNNSAEWSGISASHQDTGALLHYRFLPCNCFANNSATTYDRRCKRRLHQCRRLMQHDRPTTLSMRHRSSLVVPLMASLSVHSKNDLLFFYLFLYHSLKLVDCDIFIIEIYIIQTAVCHY